LKLWSVRQIFDSVSYEITPTRHPGMLLAGVQQFKELDSGQKPAGMTKEEFHPFVVTLGVMGVRQNGLPVVCKPA
jgi:hypothetical protein